VQGTGNGHLARATEIVPILQELGDVDILVSGIQGDINLPFAVKYKFYGFSFIFGKKGGVDIWHTITRFRPIRLIRDIFKLPVKDYDLIINDFEPVTAWACKLRKKKSVGLSHQNAVLHPQAAKPAKTDWLGKLVLKNYAPSTVRYGFHFKSFDERHFTPVIRSDVRNAKPYDGGHYTVYLPAFSDEQIIKLLGQFSDVKWEVFSKYCKERYESGAIHFSPVSFTGFGKSFVSCKGIICTAGFETPAEAIFMGKKLCVFPMKGQYEQACNAAQLADLGIPVATEISEFQKLISTWLSNDSALHISYPDKTKEILETVVADNL
jgi:uncharacterized protein (TIGR00661 family)